jgi:hypothetical protein
MKMSAETLMGAISRSRGDTAVVEQYMAHLAGHAERILAARDRVAEKAKADPKGGAAKRLKEYDATLKRYTQEVEAWKVLRPSKEEED